MKNSVPILEPIDKNYLLSSSLFLLLNSIGDSFLTDLINIENIFNNNLNIVLNVL